ncbi:BTB/POZ domain [Parelaphostrongylus tenuis]|uniref:BTB/POZ domain n=1 Tax=Parelaphostrongylus tenuis TaxID=148309 RepID=A0AAD5N1K7_PARTN|nr:BTB/POZ domain [Parelaphostrongylus tenuis]
MPPSDTVKMKMTEVSHLHVENGSIMTFIELAKMLSAENSDADLSLTVEFGSEREVFAVHKFKLITHSDVFATMFDHNTKESKTYAITIEGFSISAVRNLLVFIYTGSVSLGNLELEEVFHVMLLADKYIIPALKSMCEQELISRVRPTNVAECVELADFCGANVLYEHCLSLDRNPALTITIMERMV